MVDTQADRLAELKVKAPVETVAKVKTKTPFHKLANRLEVVKF